MRSINPNNLDLGEDEDDCDVANTVANTVANPPAPDRGGGGLKNYITQADYDTLLEERRQLQSVERPSVVQTVSWAASNGDRSENGDYAKIRTPSGLVPIEIISISYDL